MANLNKVMLIGRLTRDPEVRAFANGGKVANFGFAVNNRKKNQESGQWEEEPVFIDMEVFNRGEQGRQADLVEQYLKKGQQVFIEGHLRLNQWTAQDGQKRSRLVVRVDNFQFLERRDNGPSGAGQYSAGLSEGMPPAEQPYASPTYRTATEPVTAPAASGSEEDIPF
jgi:single-strand DNA-binding protein